MLRRGMPWPRIPDTLCADPDAALRARHRW